MNNLKSFLFLFILIIPILLSARHNPMVKPYPERKIFSYEIQGDTHWLGMGKGIVKYNALTDSVEHITEAAGIDLGIVKDIAVADSNLVWFVASDSLLLTYDGETWYDKSEELNLICRGGIGQIYIDDTSSLWAVMDTTLIKYDNIEWKVKSRTVPLKNPVTDIIYKKDILWVRSWNEVASRKNRKWKSHELSEEFCDKKISHDFRTNPASDVIILSGKNLYNLSLTSYISLAKKRGTSKAEYSTSFMVGDRGDIWYTLKKDIREKYFINRSDKNSNKSYKKYRSNDIISKAGKKITKDDNYKIWVVTDEELYKLAGEKFKKIHLWRTPLDLYINSEGIYYDLQKEHHGSSYRNYGQIYVGQEGSVIDNQEEGFWQYWKWTGDGMDYVDYLYKEGNFKNGLKVGEWVTYFSNGTIWKREPFRNGYIEGYYEEYNFNGEVISFGYFEEGMKVGQWERLNWKEQIISYGEYFDNEKVGKWESYSINDELLSYTHYQKGLKHGKAKKIFENGCYGVAEYSRGEITQDWEYYNSNNEMIHSIKNPNLLKTPAPKDGEQKKGHYITLMDKRFKPVTVYENAKYYRVADYIDGKPVGIVRDYYLDGQLQFEGKMISEFPSVYDGMITIYNHKGELKRQDYYENGKKSGNYANTRIREIVEIEPRVDPNTGNKYKQFDIRFKHEEIYDKDGDKADAQLTGEWVSQERGEYVEGRKNGEWIELKKNKENIEVKWVGNYINGKRDGIWRKFEKDIQVDMKRYKNGRSEKPVDLNKVLPPNFLSNLKFYECKPVVVQTISSIDWQLKLSLEILMRKIRSKKPVSSVLRVDCKYWDESKTSTEGREAMYMIEGFIQGSYPPTESSFTDFDPDPEYYRKWWREYGKKK